jgi:hypothetical protein
MHVAFSNVHLEARARRPPLSKCSDTAIYLNSHLSLRGQIRVSCTCAVNEE